MFKMERSSLPSYNVRCQLLGLSSLADRRIVSDSMFAFDLILGKTNCSELLEQVPFVVNSHGTRSSSVTYARAHRTIYGFHNPLERCLRNFSNFDSFFDFNSSNKIQKINIECGVDYVSSLSMLSRGQLMSVDK
jgi:hypothetical protein